jgi:predicted N-acyltransferase
VVGFHQVKEEGWLPTHVTIRLESTGALVGCCPLYLKGHSYGECVALSGYNNAGMQRSRNSKANSVVFAEANV